MMIPVVLNQLILMIVIAFQVGCQIINIRVSKQCIFSTLSKFGIQSIDALNGLM